MTKEPRKPKGVVSGRVDVEVQEEFVAICVKEDRSASWMLNKALREFVEKRRQANNEEHHEPTRE